MQTDVMQGFRLSPQQKRLWSLRQKDADRIYRAQCAVRIRGRLEVAHLKTAIERAVARHEILRTSFPCLAGMTIPLQVVDETGKFQLTRYEWQQFSAEDQATGIENLWNEAQRTVFNLERSGQLQLWLVKLSDEEHHLLLSLPAICADASGLHNLVAEICGSYDAIVSGRLLADPAMQYVDISEWQNELFDAEDREAGRTYWRKQDLSSLATLRLPYEQEATGRFAPQVLAHVLGPDLVSMLEAFADKYETPVLVLLLTCWHVLLGRLTSQTSTIVGAALNPRKYEVLEGSLGLLTKYVPVDCEIKTESSFADLLQQQREKVRKANTWQENFVWENINESEAATGYFPFCFDYEERADSYEGGGVKFSIYRQYVNTERYHVRLSCVRSGEQLRAEFHYDEERYRAADIERLAAQFETLLRSVTANAAARVAELEVMGAAEREQVLVQWNQTEREYGAEQSVVELFEQQAAQRGEAVALVYEDEQLRYAELNERANQVARYLVRLGVGAEVRVGLCVERSLEMIVGVLGILKAGGAYVPLEPQYPRERLEYMLRESGAQVLLTQEQLVASLPVAGVQVVSLDGEWDAIAQESKENLGERAQGENLAYVIYTSGSSGRPKGVGVTHANLVHSTAARLAYYAETPERFLLLSSFAFDSSVAGIFWTLCAGGALVLPQEGLQRDAQGLVRLIAAAQVTHLLGLPSLYEALLQTKKGDELAGLKTVVVAGEASRPALVQRHYGELSGTRLYNEYGPTEATVWATVHECAQSNERTVPIGKVISNATLYILDERQQPIPIGMAGELYIGGMGIARGYLERSDASAEKFVPDGFGAVAGARLYRTGDLGRYLDDGTVEFLGRVDNQVKIRGFRVELGEIEAALDQYRGIAKSVVVLSKAGSGDGRLVAYIVPEDGVESSDAEIHAYLQEKLPAYMIPWAIARLAELPLTPNGKVDRQALPEPAKREEALISARTPVEEVLAGIWAELLGMDEVSATANFFDLGGHSLLVTQVVSRIREAFGIELPVRSLFATPTVRGLAAAVEQELSERQGMVAPPLRAVARNEELPLSYAQQRLWFLDQLEPDSAFYNCPGAVRLSGELNVPALEQTVREIIRRHEVLRTSFPAVAGRPVQVIAPRVEFNLAVTDLSAWESGEAETEARRLAQVEAQTPFDLANGPLLRVKLLKLSETEHVALFTMHHIVSDAWSMGVLIKEVSHLYEVYCHGVEAPLPELPVQYADYAVWQREWLQGEVLERQLEYWREQLRGAPELLALPTDRLRPALQSFVGASEVLLLPAEVATELKSLSRREGMTLFMTLLAGWQTLLYSYSGQEQIVVGTPIANRTRAETENLIGFFVNALVLRTDVSGNPSFMELLRRVREVCLGAYTHQDVPFEKLVEELRPERSVSYSPLVQAWFTLQQAASAEVRFKELTLHEFKVDNITSKYDLVLSARDTGQELRLMLDYNSDLFNAGTVSLMLKTFQALLTTVASRPEVRVAELRILIVEEVKKQQKAKEKDLEIVDRRRLKTSKRRPITEATVAG